MGEFGHFGDLEGYRAWPNLDHCSIRTAPGPTYKAADESVVAEVAAGTEAYPTVEGLGVSGALALFRVYVVLNTLNERE